MDRLMFTNNDNDTHSYLAEGVRRFEARNKNKIDALNYI